MKRCLVVMASVACAVLLVAATGPKSEPQLGSGSISGVVTDSLTGAPIEGAKVTAGCCGRQAFTGSDGSYTIANLNAGDYTVKAMKCGYVMKQYPTPVHVEEGQAVTGIDFALMSSGGGGGNGSISGTVYDKLTNEPIAGAKVTAGCCNRYALTGSDGTYTIVDLADGSYTVKAMKEGYKCAVYPDPVVILKGQPVSGIDFYLMPCSNRALD